MQIASLFLIASAVLAMPTAASDSNAVAGLEKRAKGFYFPDDEILANPKQEAKKSEDVDYPFKGSKANTGEFCSTWAKAATLEEVPVECMRPVFCNENRVYFKMGCPDDPQRFPGSFTKDEVLDATTVECVLDSICRPWETYAKTF